MKETIEVKADPENSAESWWEAYREEGEFVGELSNWTTVNSEQFERLKSLPGWADGPDYAPHALVTR